MKKIIIFTLGFLLAVVLGVIYKTFFQNKPTILENPFSINEKSETTTINMSATSTTTATSTTH